jgi:hypothetical protein
MSFTAGAAPCVGAALMGKRVRLHSLNSIVYNDMSADVIGARSRCVCRACAAERRARTRPCKQGVRARMPADMRACVRACARSRSSRAQNLHRPRAGWDHPTGRWMVRLESGKELKVKPDNATFEDAADEPLAAMAAAMAASMSTAAMSTAGAGAAPGGFTCAVCYEDYGAENRAILPCCGKVESTVQYCKRCIEIIVEQGFGGTVGRCPTCSQLISIQGGVITGGHIVSSCRMCMQERPIADSRSVLCEMCVLGRSFTMRYECERCHRVQRIPHPMFRYQEEGATSFGTTSWVQILNSAP